MAAEFRRTRGTTPLLLVDDVLATSPPLALPELRVAGPTQLDLDSAGEPRLRRKRSGIPAPRSRFRGVWLEPLATSQGAPSLLLLRPRGTWARVNGGPAPAAAVLALGDQLQLSPRTVLHVTGRREAFSEAPAQTLLGSPCPLCLEPFRATSRVAPCPSCGSALHDEREADQGADALDCARRVATCLDCGAPRPASPTNELLYVP